MRGKPPPFPGLSTIRNPAGPHRLRHSVRPRAFRTPVAPFAFGLPCAGRRCRRRSRCSRSADWRGRLPPFPGLRRSDDVDDIDYPSPQGAGSTSGNRARAGGPESGRTLRLRPSVRGSSTSSMSSMSSTGRPAGEAAPFLRPFDDPTTSTTSTTLRRKSHPSPSAFRASSGIPDSSRTLRLRPSVRGSSMSSISSTGLPTPGRRAAASRRAPAGLANWRLNPSGDGDIIMA